METKQYSDFWRLFVSPFKGGINQVVQSGTLKKGFWGTVFLWAIPYIALALFGTMLIPFLPHNEFTGLTYLIGIGASFMFIFAWLISIGYMIVFILMGLLGVVFDSSAIAGVMYFVGTIALFIISIWVSLELMARQVMLTKMKVFIAAILTSVVFVIIWVLFMALLGGCVSMVGR